MKFGLVEWLGSGLVCAWVWVQTLEDLNETLFLANCEGRERFLIVMFSCCGE